MEAIFLPQSSGVYLGTGVTNQYTYEGVAGYILADVREASLRSLSLAPISQAKWRGSTYYLTEDILKLAQSISIETNVDSLKLVLKERYGDNAWVNQGVGESYIYIHYPVIEIENSLGVTHTIKDLVVKLTAVGDGHYISQITQIMGRRYTLTDSELISGYAHSHLHVGQAAAFSSFCLGTDTVLDRYRRGNICLDNHTQLNWDVFFHQMDKYVAWESLEGTPYISISSIDSVGVNVPQYFSMNDTDIKHCFVMAGIMLAHIESMESIDFIKPRNNSMGCRYEVRITEQYVKVLNELWEETDLILKVTKFDPVNKRYIGEGMRDGSIDRGDFLRSNSLTNPNLSQQIRPVVIDSPSSVWKLVLHPQIVTSITNYFEQLLNEAAFYAFTYEQTESNHYAATASNDSQPALLLPAQ